MNMARKKYSRGKGRGKKEKKVFPVVEGRVQMTREGYAFIIVGGEEDDVFVKASKTRGALNGDTVRVTVTREKGEKQRREGEVIEILQRSPKPFIGILHIVGNQAWVLMQSRFMPYDITIPFTESDKVRYRRHNVRGQSLAEPKDETGWLKPVGDDMYAVHRVFAVGEDGSRQELAVRSGMKVAAVVDDWPRSEMSPRGHLVDVLGEPGENDTEMHAILAEYALPYRFEAEVANAADAISEEITAEDLKGRRDFRDILTFTIDPADAKDFDDALSFRKLENGNYEVGVHIADVTHYVRPGSVVDKEAQERGTSVYLVDRTVPMLPEKLCNKLCSLRPNEEKLTFSAVFEMTPLGRIVDQWFGKTAIYSDFRFAYEEAQAIIDNPAGEHAGVPSDIVSAVLTLHGLATKLRKKRFAAGAINFDRPEMKVEVDEKGRPVNVYQKITKEANWLIEEFMLLANRSVAEFVATGCKGVGEAPAKGARRQAKTFVYRVHDEPNQEKLANLRNFIGNFGYKMGPTTTGKEISKELNSLFLAAKDTPEYNAIELLSLRTMAKARYDTENLGHYGLAFKYYTHFTSPIRRYPDMLVHRLLADYLGGAPSAKLETFDKLCKHASEREIIAAEAERASIKYKLVEYMQDKVGYVFGGHVSGLTEWGMYVEVEPTMIEGMVPLRDIRSDFFEFDADRYRLVGRRSGIVYNLGDPVRIRVKKTNLEQKLLDYELIESGLEDRMYDRIDYEQGRGTSFIKGVDGSFDNVTVGINKAARKEKVRKAIQESKRKSRKAASAKRKK